MPADKNRGEATPSILDRLTDLDPESQRDSFTSSWQQEREVKAAICRDLAWLFNSRRAETPFDPAYEQAASSLLTYGIADFTSYDLTNGNQQDLVRRSLERAIRLFEPRLARVAVTMEQPDPLRPVLRFQIDAVLRLGPDAESVTFNATLQRDTRRLSVTGTS